MTNISITGFSKLTIKELEDIKKDCEWEIGIKEGNNPSCIEYDYKCHYCPLGKIAINLDNEVYDLCDYYMQFEVDDVALAKKVLARVRREFSMKKGFSGKMGTIGLPKKEVSKNQIYEEQILPLANKILAICEQNEISSIGKYDLGNEVIELSRVFKDSDL